MTEIDIIIPLKPSLVNFALNYTLPKVIQHIPHRHIYILSNSNSNSIIKKQYGKKVNYLDEDGVISHLSKTKIETYFTKRINNKERSGWYFQQFLKLALSQIGFISSHYLVWDADCIPLKPLFFLENNKTLLTVTDEHNSTYFKTIKTLINIDKQVEFSFISEHMLFNKLYVNELIHLISKTNQPWWQNILDAIGDSDLASSGFSEYEFYGNYISYKHPAKFKTRRLKQLRDGKRYLGMNPKASALKRFQKYFDYISFEEWKKTLKPNIKRIIKLELFLLKQYLKFRFKSSKKHF